MSTRSLIALKKEDGTFEAIYCHWNGYLSWNGRLLLEHYKTYEKVEKLISLGSISVLGCNPFVELSENKIDGFNECVSDYHRLSNEEINIQKFETFKELDKFFKNSWCEYMYYFTKGKDGKYIWKFKQIVTIKENIYYVGFKNDYDSICSYKLYERITKLRNLTNEEILIEKLAEDIYSSKRDNLISIKLLDILTPKQLNKAKLYERYEYRYKTIEYLRGLNLQF